MDRECERNLLDFFDCKSGRYEMQTLMRGSKMGEK